MMYQSKPQNFACNEMAVNQLESTGVVLARRGCWKEACGVATIANSRGRGGARRGRWTEACAGWTRLKEDDEVSGKA